MVKMNSVKLVVLGDDNVGKSAVTVRFLTKRFIGEYDSNADLVYKQILAINDTQIELEVLDSANKKNTHMPSDDALNWADAFTVVYSICDRKSFEKAKVLIKNIQESRSPSHVPIILMANKLDLEHTRQVGVNDGMKLSDEVGCQFAEVSAADGVDDIINAFQTLIREVTALSPTAKRRKNSFGTVSKAISSFFSSKNKNLNSNSKRKMLASAY